MKRIFPSNPVPSKELQLLIHLHPRMNFSTAENGNFNNLQKGHFGEVKLYHLLKNEKSSNHIILFDLLLESNNTESQIDCLLIDQQTIILLEVKNYEGDFYMERDQWYVVGSGKEIRNPLQQLQRSEFLMKQLLQKLNVKMTIKSYVVFVNEAFTLYQVPLGLPYIFPTQLQRFIQKQNANSKTPTTLQHRLAEKLIAMNMEESVHSRLPVYKYEQLRKGIICSSCFQFLSHFTKVKFICKNCETEEAIESAVMRSVEEFALLFPDRKITTSAVWEWCQVVESKKMIRRILTKHMKIIPKGRSSHFLFQLV